MAVARTSFTQGETLCFRACGASIASGAVVLVGPATQEPGKVSQFEAPLVFDSGITWKADVDSTTFAPGPWAFEVWAVRDGINRLEKTGQIAIKASLQNLTSSDVRSTAQQIVDSIEAYLKGNASSLVRRYKINNRELERHTISELLTLLKFYRRQLKLEKLRNPDGTRKTGATFIWRM